VNGVVMHTFPNAAQAVIFNNTQNSIFVGRNNPASFDDVRIYTRTLSNAQICRSMMGGTMNGSQCVLPP
jgi:hypothetical protein